jgi:hypothetical protein
MSKGPGRVQQAILALIAAQPDGAWSFDELCGLIYPPGEWVKVKSARVRRPRTQLVAIGRALARMTLPGTWTTGSPRRSPNRWLYDACSLASVRKIHADWGEHCFEPGGTGFRQVDEAKRNRDASPLACVETRIKSARGHMATLGKFLRSGDGDVVASITSQLRKAAEWIEALEKERAALLAQEAKA